MMMNGEECCCVGTGAGDEAEMGDDDRKDYTARR